MKKDYFKDIKFIIKERYDRHIKNKYIREIIYVIASPNRDIINGIGLARLIWSGSKFFSILQSVLNSIWVGAKQRWFIIAKAIAFLIFIASGIFFWASFLFRSLISAIRGINIAGIAFGNVGWFWWFLKYCRHLLHQ